MTKGYGTRLFITFLFVLAILTGYNYFFRPFRFVQLATPSPTPAVVAPQLELSKKEQILADFSTDQKIAQIIAAPITAQNDDDSTIATATDSADLTRWQNLSWVKAHAPGFVTLFGTDVNVAEVTSLKLDISQSLNAQPVLPFLAVDHEGGSVQRLTGSGFTSLESWNSLCKLEPEVLNETLSGSAQELSEAGIDMVFAPVLDIYSANSALKDRSCSDDPAVIARAATAYVVIFSEYGIRPVLKHFPGIGQLSTDLHKQFASITVNSVDSQLYRTMLEDYSSLGVMVSHVGVANQNADIPCSLNPDCVGELHTVFPEVLIVSDALDMDAAGHRVASGSANLPLENSLAERAVAAVRAGNNVLVFGDGVSAEELDTVFTALKQQYEVDPTFQQQINLSVAKILERKL